MKKPPKPSSKSNRRLSPSQWIEAEELYRNGWTQAQISDRFKVRVETVSRHMTKRSVKGGERAESVREELSAALAKKQREFAEAKAQRQIDSKEMMFKMTNILVSAFAKEFQVALSTGKGLSTLQGSAKALKDSLMSLKVGREELYAILEIKDDGAGENLPSLTVNSMTEADEAELRARIEPDDEDEEEAAAALAAEMDDIVTRVDHEVELSSVHGK